MECHISLINDIDAKRDIMIQCDSAFTESISLRSDFEVYLDKIHEFGIFIAAKANNIVLGYAVMYANDKITKEAFVTLICVKEEFQGKGIGSLLMADCYQKAIIAGMRSMRLEVLKADSTQKNFYEKQGFRIVGETEDRCIMQKQLK